MTKIISLPTIAAALLACGLSAAPAQAGPNRTFVSGKGTDSGTCAYAAPCRTFAFALTQTAAGGEIDVLDPAGYGAVTITKAISIVNDGVGVAAIGASSGNGVTINAGATDSVHLRGLTIAGLGSGSDGILFNSGGNLAIENCVIRGFANNGVLIAPTGSVKAVLRNVTADDNFDGIDLFGNFSPIGSHFNVTIVDSEASNNTNAGVVASASPTSKAAIGILRNVVASNNGTGLKAEKGVLLVAHSVVAGNFTGVSTDSGAFILSYGDNNIDGNGTDESGTVTLIPMH